MRAFPSFHRITGIVLILSAAGSLAASATSAAGLRRGISWAALGVGLAPSPFGLDQNGSPIGDVVLGRELRKRLTAVVALGHIRFSGGTPTQFTPLSVGARIHLSPTHAADGGPYIGAAALMCRAVYRDGGAAKARLLLGVEATVGTMIPLTRTLAVDWSASHVLTPDADGFSPSSGTGSTRRDGLDRGMVRVRLVLHR